MDSLRELTPVLLLLVGGVPFFVECRGSARHISLGIAIFLGLSVVINAVFPQILLSNPTLLVSFTFLSFAFMAWQDRRVLLTERTSGLLFLHSVTFLYGVSLHFGAASSWFALSLLACTAVGAAAFFRDHEKTAFRVALTLWSALVLAGLSLWQIRNALSPDGVASLLWMSHTPHPGLSPAVSTGVAAGLSEVTNGTLTARVASALDLVRGSSKLILFGGSFAFLLISALTAVRGAWFSLLEWAALRNPASNRGAVRSIGVAPMIDRRFPLPGFFAVLICHALPLFLVRVFAPHASEAWVLNFSLAASPLLIIGLLRRTGWSGLGEVPLQDESELDRMRRSSLHRQHPNHAHHDSPSKKSAS